MKINARSSLWQLVTDRLSLWRLNKVEKDTAYIKQVRNQKQFLPWNQKELNLLPDYQSAAVNFKVLEQLVKIYPKNERNFRGYISSHLQDDSSPFSNVKRKLAVDRMVDLIESTVSEVRSIELNHLAKNKG